MPAIRRASSRTEDAAELLAEAGRVLDELEDLMRHAGEQQAAEHE